MTLLRLLTPVVAVLALTGCVSDSGTTADPIAPVDNEFQQDVNGARSTVEEYWAAFFETQGGQFVPVNEVLPYTEEGEGSCGGEPFVLNNAFYCPVDHFIAYDANFLADQYAAIGDAFVFYVIGHEYAHAVQEQLGITHRLTIQHELQADCMAGAYLGDSVRGNRLKLEDGDIDELLVSLETVGDQPGIPWFAEGAHGTGEERTDAFSKGSGGSLSACI
ncbi:neutral zinc metallopeptidase [Kineosporia succinea]|uniref:Metalloprotease n=1 Tax=Kineosporia succinea TaxID=84632 RepID=A0ABT9NXP3_9ACTN|nr:neutral zinc metallopeptidase [Kineosporia succinea]MDP9825047.1 putative metalloprotease [Kineosporia succinea]